MENFLQFLNMSSVTHSLFILSLVAAVGLFLGSMQVGGIRLGVTGVLFSGLFFAHFGLKVDHEILEFSKQFGLMLFVYTLGLQVGPGFISSLRNQGLKLNAFAAFIVVTGTLLTIAISLFAHIPMASAVGMFSGSTSNTPSLGSAQQALASIPGIDESLLKLPALGYAVSYPFGMLGTIFLMIIIRLVFKIDINNEARDHEIVEGKNKIPLSVRNIRVDNPNLNGIAITNIPNLDETEVVISRVMHEGKVRVALGETKIFVNDVLYVVGPQNKLDALEMIVGSRSEIDVRQIQSNIVSERLIITRPEAVGKTLAELKVWERYGVTVTRISRAEIEFPASSDIALQYADTLIAVGQEDDIDEFSEEIGNSPKQLNNPFIIPLFLGLVLGIFLGSIPFNLPGIPVPVKLGVAGGPLLVAIILSRIGHIGKLIWYMPISANFMLREMGIVLFLTGVGMSCGDHFVETLVAGQGIKWMLWGTLITIIPITLAALFARIKCKMNYLTLCGVLAGSMTNPSALAYMNHLVSSNPAVSAAYATVYPLVMILRVIISQLLVVYFVS